MKYVLKRKIPEASDILLMESGSPEVARRALESIRRTFPDARYHLCTCQPVSVSEGFSSVLRVSDYSTPRRKLGLLFSLRRKPWQILAILCTGEPIMWYWKMLAVFLLPLKVLVVNENADYFWLDIGHRQNLRRFLSDRWGVNLEALLLTSLRALLFPLTILYLILNASFLYLRRARRLLLWKITGPPSHHSGIQARPPERTSHRNGAESATVTEYSHAGKEP